MQSIKELRETKEQKKEQKSKSIKESNIKESNIKNQLKEVIRKNKDNILFNKGISFSNINCNCYLVSDVSRLSTALEQIRTLKNKELKTFNKICLKEVLK